MPGPPLTEVVANGPSHITPPARLSDLREALSMGSLSAYTEACGMLRSSGWLGYPQGTVRFAGSVVSSSFSSHVFDVRTNDRSVIAWIDQLLAKARTAEHYTKNLRLASHDVAYASSTRSLTEVTQRLTPAQARTLRAIATHQPESSPASRDNLAAHGLITIGGKESDRPEITIAGLALLDALNRRAPLADLRAARRTFIELVALARRYGWRTKETDRRTVDGTVVATFDRGNDHLLVVFQPDPTSGRWCRTRSALITPAGKTTEIRSQRPLTEMITTAPAAAGCCPPRTMASTG